MYLHVVEAVVCLQKCEIMAYCTNNFPLVEKSIFSCDVNYYDTHDASDFFCSFADITV